MKKISMVLFAAFSLCGILLLTGTLYASKAESTRYVLREEITLQHDNSRGDDNEPPLKLTTRLTLPPSYLQMAMNTLSEWGVPIDPKEGSKSMALTALLLAVIL
ncbi:MAG: hypothetical protein HQL80_01590 [Magnetococcales bacterium]|nr:hypothetical protein [Magnetococcales bacterium]